MQMAVPLRSDISDAENNWLTREITLEEVWQAVKRVDPLKAPGPDGMHAFFIRDAGV